MGPMYIETPYIIRRVISSLMGSMYTETLYITMYIISRY